jgi:hypothetical protein
VATSSSQSDSNLNDPRSADAPAIQSPEVRSTAGRRINKKQLNAEPAEPPSASPTPLRGQVETNQSVKVDETTQQPNELAAEKAFRELRSKRWSEAEANPARLAAQRAAFDLGWQGYLQRGRSPATHTENFESVEPELAQLWRLKQALQPERLPWEEAKETARDAWNCVHDALAGGQ